MKEKSDILEDVKNKLLSDAISFISISDVDAKIAFDGAHMLYVKTSNMGTVEYEKIEDLATKYSNEEVLVTAMIPDAHKKSVVNDSNEHVISAEKNTDTICIFIELKKG